MKSIMIKSIMMVNMKLFNTDLNAIIHVDENYVCDQERWHGETRLQTPQIAPAIFEPVFHVPYEQNPYFTGRDEFLESIRLKLQDDQIKGYKTTSCTLRPWWGWQDSNGFRILFSI